VKVGKTTVLDAAQARQLLDSIDATTVVGLRDRALIAVTTFAFARVSAIVAMRVEDYLPKGKRWWLRFSRKAASNSSCRRITIWQPISKRISKRLVSARIG
jgi:hypothetical protein